MVDRGTGTHETSLRTPLRPRLRRTVLSGRSHHPELRQTIPRRGSARWNLVIHIHPGRKLWTKPKRLLLGPGLSDSALASPKKVIQAIAEQLGLKGTLRAASEQDSLSRIKGWILPLTHEKGHWVSDKWKLPAIGTYR